MNLSSFLTSILEVPVSPAYNSVVNVLDDKMPTFK